MLFSVLKMDAGPILRQLQYPLKGHEKSTDLLQTLFRLGALELVSALPSVFDGTATTVQQDDSLATPAPKLSTNESYLDLSLLSARECHNRCRAFSGWPGTWTFFRIGSDDSLVRVKVVTTCIIDGDRRSSNTSNKVSLVKHEGVDVLRVECGDGSLLGVSEVQPAGKKEMSVKAYVNGLRGADLFWSVAHSPSSSSVDHK